MTDTTQWLLDLQQVTRERDELKAELEECKKVNAAANLGMSMLRQRAEAAEADRKMWAKWMTKADELLGKLGVGEGHTIRCHLRGCADAAREGEE